MLSESKLAAELKMSKTPIRSALRALHLESLLEGGPRNTMVVCGFPAEQRHELLQVREALERLAVSHACRTMSVDDFDHLSTILRRQQRAADAGLQEEFVRLDEDMHLMIAERSGLQFVPKLLSQLRGFVSLMQLNTRRDPGYLTRVVDEHHRIVDALESRDEAATLDALAVHLHTSQYIVEEPARVTGA